MHDEMFPARAGMNRTSAPWCSGTGHVPRPCGDEPPVHQWSIENYTCSPPVRG